MRIAELIQRWAEESHGSTAVRSYAVRLPMRDAARIEALRVMYPRRTESQLMADLIRAALDELEIAMPYVPGSRIIAGSRRGCLRNGERNCCKPKIRPMHFLGTGICLSTRHISGNWSGRMPLRQEKEILKKVLRIYSTDAR